MHKLKLMARSNNNKHKKQGNHRHDTTKKHSSISRAFCCGSRPSISSSSPTSSSSFVDGIIRTSNSLSRLAHAMVQARLQQMIDDGERCMRDGGGSRRCVLLMAKDVKSYDPKEDFRASMEEVIRRKGLEEPKELRSLLNCYISVNPREHRQAILEAFYEVCCSLFT